MALDSLTLFNGARRLVVRFLNTDTTAGETDVVKVDKSTLTGPDGTEPSRLVVEEIQWAVTGGAVTLEWDHTTDDEIAVLTAGQGRSVYPGNGLVDPASAGATGDIVLTVAAAAGTYDITLVLRKKD